MEIEEKIALLNASLESAAEQLCDITPRVMELFYARFPQARAMFTELYVGDPKKLEGEMVQQTLYCLMEWFESPGEIEIILMTTIPHHIETLKVHSEYFAGLIDSVCSIIMDTIPPNETGQQAVWDELRSQMRTLVENEGYLPP